jgi:hypothetical protein
MQPGGREAGHAEVIGLGEQFNLGAASNDALSSRR